MQSCAGLNFSVQESSEPWGSVAQDCTKELTWLGLTPSTVRGNFAGSFAFFQCTRDVPLVNLGWTKGLPKPGNSSADSCALSARCNDFPSPTPGGLGPCGHTRAGRWISSLRDLRSEGDSRHERGGRNEVYQHHPPQVSSFPDLPLD